MIKFNEFLILESFSLDTKPIKNTIQGARDKFSDIFVKYYTDYSKEDAMSTFDELRNSYTSFTPFIRTYRDAEYLIYIGNKIGSDYYEIYFHKISDLNKQSQNNDASGDSMSLFQEIFKIVYWYGLYNGENVIIKSPEGNPKRLQTYIFLVKKLINKVKNATYSINGNNILIEYKRGLLESKHYFNIRKLTGKI